jgi:phospholipid/cholesterol/gamma-HCH transport system substrate-binding protein
MALPVPKISNRGGNLFETIISAMVILVAAGFGVYVFILTGTHHLGSYPLRISMANASGLSVGTEVRLAGARVGTVSGVALDQRSYRALVRISIRDDLLLPADSSAQIASSPMGDTYLSLTPGHAPRILPKDGLLGAPSPLPPSSGRHRAS